MPQVDRIAIIGLDCAEPSLVFDRWRSELPNLSRLAARGLHGRLASCIPPITVPAWACMGSGRDPGTLGVYGFRNRADRSYDKFGIATNLDIHEPRLWDYVSQAGGDSLIVGVPPTYPIRNPPRGCMVSCFLTPGAKSVYTHPPALAAELESRFGPPIFDAEDFKTDDKRALLERIHKLARQRFEVCRRLLATRPWKLFWMVELGVDRMHHAFWRYMDREHRRHEPGHPLESAIHDYYLMVDRELGELLGLVESDRTAIWVVSDHGAKRMVGGFCINDWLIQRGLLRLKQPPVGVQPFRPADVDWTRTKAWGEGGYYGRLYINRAGREPQGIVAERDSAALVAELSHALESQCDHLGRPMGTRVYRPAELYQKLNGVPPELIMHFGDMSWRSVGAVGNASLHVFENETAPDDANHAPDGMYILTGPDVTPRSCDASIYDVLPTSLAMMGLSAPPDLRGVILR